jgi:hypothetical protein
MSLQGNVNVLESRKNTLVINVGDLSHRKNAFQNPDLSGRARQMFKVLEDEGPKRTLSCTKDGRKVLVTNLVLGTLTTTYDPEITPPAPSKLKLEFEPHSALSDKLLGDFLPDEIMTRWFVEPGYQGQKINAKYDFAESGGKPPNRALSLRTNQKETWVWTITSGKDFEKDIADVIVYMGYKIPNGEETKNDVWRQQIAWNERRTPGIILSAWKFMRNNFIWFLSIISALLGIRLTQLEIRAARTKQGTEL